MSGGVGGGAGNDPAYPMYVGHAFVLGGGSPLRPREAGPLSEGKGVAVRRGLKEAGATATA
jgi:hypothetical protein